MPCTAGARGVVDAGTGTTDGAGRRGGDQVERSDRGRPKGRAERVIVHGEVLGILPQGSNCVAIEVTHDDTGRAVLAAALPLPLRGLYEVVHPAAIEGQ